VVITSVWWSYALEYTATHNLLSLPKCRNYCNSQNLQCNRLSNLHLPSLDRMGSTLKPLMHCTDFCSSRPCKNSIYNSRQHLTIFICFRLLPCCCSRNNSSDKTSCLHFFAKQSEAGFTIQLNNIILSFITCFLHEPGCIVVFHKL